MNPLFRTASIALLVTLALVVPAAPAMASSLGVSASGSCVKDGGDIACTTPRGPVRVDCVTEPVSTKPCTALLATVEDAFETVGATCEAAGQNCLRIIIETWFEVIIIDCLYWWAYDGVIVGYDCDIMVF